ncbi:MAG: 1-deoxy-D-xylulose-5-phosphate synthase [Eubacteriales bacterium]|nr:1-deoxy-D-xylulose-5-phosphate synthase [Eubacteriales bacterium]
MSLLEQVNSPADIKNLSVAELKLLAAEIRQFMIETIRENGGHLASNLGVVELTLALYYVFDFPTDKLVWDVGHQCYVHKIITGRREQFSTLRKQGGISGFPQRDESEYDAFDTGHSGTALSAATGFAAARDYKGETHEVVAVVGDGAFAGGMNFEAINALGEFKNKIIVVLNDNEMSISRNVGAFSEKFFKLRTNKRYESFKSSLERFLGKGSGASRFTKKLKDAVRFLFIPGQFFDELGLKYIGITDGHDIEKLIDILRRAKEEKYSCVVHAITQKGKGFDAAEADPEQYHGVAPFCLENGETSEKKGFSALAGDELCRLASEDERVVAVSAGMICGTGLTKFKEQFPGCVYDVGICEQQAATMSAALAVSGLKPFFAVYSTFLQRCYDQILEDICLAKTNVTLLIDRAGLNGEDGKTHQGIYDVALLRSMPGMSIMAPSTEEELREMIRLAHDGTGAYAIRYPKSAYFNPYPHTPVEYGKWQVVSAGQDIAIVTFGAMLGLTARIMEKLKERAVYPTLINARFLKPIDEEETRKLQRYKDVVVIEDNIAVGGLADALEGFFSENDVHGVNVHRFCVPDRPIAHASVEEQQRELRLDENGILERIMEICGEKRI